jgi:hypothetical protein
MSQSLEAVVEQFVIGLLIAGQSERAFLGKPGRTVIMKLLDRY